MEIPATSVEDVLALPIRARLFAALSDLRRPGTTRELADRVGRHPNTVRVQLGQLLDAGLVERRTTRQTRGRPRDEWAIAREAKPAGQPPQAHGQLSHWLARALGASGDFERIERSGREIGREIAPEARGRGLAETMQDTLTSLGFTPARERPAPDRLRYVLGNCPYRDAVRQNQPAVCTLHRGITSGLLDRLDPQARLADFVAKDPDTAGCVIDVTHPRVAG